MSAPRTKSIYAQSRILVTGGTGSIGLELVRTLLRHNPREIRVFSNDENGLFEASNFLGSPSVTYFLGDVRDPRSIERAMSGCDIVFHAAALKHVIFCEANPYEAISTNIVGTQNMIECAVKYSVKRFVFISTDKAANPVSAMGATKLLGERLVSNAGERASGTTFSIVRFGNVLGSRGSVVVIFERQVKEGKPITVTDPSMTRFIMAPSDASALILRATEIAMPGEIFVLKMRSVKIGELAEACKSYFSKIYHKDASRIMTKVIGAQPGEKKHELLMTADEAANALDFGKYFIINPHPSRARAAVKASSDAKPAASNSVLPSERKEIVSILSKLYG